MEMSDFSMWENKLVYDKAKEKLFLPQPSPNETTNNYAI
jgi:hypothetical protein